MPTGNLLLSVLDKFDIHQDSIGDSTGRLENLYEADIGDNSIMNVKRLMRKSGRLRRLLLSTVGFRRGPLRRRGRGNARRQGGCPHADAQKADVNAPQADGATALHWAVYHGDKTMADLLIAAARTSRRRTVRAPHRCGWPASTAMPP